jgi:Skp family chaperone for outer membrane proteins
MKTRERLFVYSALLACILLALRPQLASVASASPRAGTPGAEPAAARIATCDVYEVVEKLVAGERFEEPRKAEEERIRLKMKPLEDDLAAMESELKEADPKDEAAQARARDFQRKRSEYTLLRGRAQQDYTDFVAGQYVAAFEEAKASAAAIAERLGYTHVIASRTSEKKIKATDPERLVEAFLGRPMTVMPEGSDITEEVKEDLKLD